MDWPGTGDGGWGRHRGGVEAERGGQPVWRVRAVEGDTSWMRDGDQGRRRGRAEAGHGAQPIWSVQAVEGVPSTDAPPLGEQLDKEQVGTGVERGRSTTSRGGTRGGGGCHRWPRWKGW
jgi:hypothetical protein